MLFNGKTQTFGGGESGLLGCWVVGMLHANSSSCIRAGHHHTAIQFTNVSPLIASCYIRPLSQCFLLIKWLRTSDYQNNGIPYFPNYYRIWYWKEGTKRPLCWKQTQFAQAETAHSPCLLHNSPQHHLQHNPFSVYRSSLCAKHHDMFHEGWLIWTAT